MAVLLPWAVLVESWVESVQNERSPGSGCEQNVLPTRVMGRHGCLTTKGCVFSPEKCRRLPTKICKALQSLGVPLKLLSISIPHSGLFKSS